jgi:septation ring formation regulator EzrA
MYSIVTIIVIVVVIALVAGWVMRGRGKKLPEAGPTMPDLSIAEEVQRIEQLHDAGEMTDAEYREAKSKLLS